MDMSVLSTLVVDRVVQTSRGAAEQQVRLAVLKEAMQTQESAAAALLSAVAGNLPLADSGSLGKQVNTMV